MQERKVLCGYGIKLSVLTAKNIPVCELLLNTRKLTKFGFAQHENRTYVGQREVRTYLKE